MQLSRRLASALGGALLFAAALALSLPGVRPVRAEGPGSAAASPETRGARIAADGPMCRASAAPDVAAVAQLVRELRERGVRELHEGEPRPVNLNTRGYNYRSGNLGAELLAVVREASLRRQAAPQP